MKRFLLASAAVLAFSTTAFAADRPVPYKAAPMVAPVFTWSGCYGGIEGGYAWGKATSVDIEIVPGEVDARPDPKGGLAGGTLGCNFQASPNWVWGVEGDMSWADIKGSSPFFPVPTFTRTTQQDWLATARGRLGYAVDRSLWYVTGGAVFAGVKEREFDGAGVDVLTKNRRTGWVVGAGVEWALAAPQWSVKVEYLYADLGKALSAGAPVTDQRDHIRESIVRVGINYRFGDWGKSPVVAKY